MCLQYQEGQETKLLLLNNIKLLNTKVFNLENIYFNLIKINYKC